MNLEDLTIREVKELISLVGGSQQQSHSFQIGTAYLIRTVTMHYTGRVVTVTDSDIVLEDAAWIADTGRYADSLISGTLSEIEPYQKSVSVSRGCIVDFTEWVHSLPREQK